jgi:hypothetical protein
LRVETGMAGIERILPPSSPEVAGEPLRATA